MDGGFALAKQNYSAIVASMNERKRRNYSPVDAAAAHVLTTLRGLEKPRIVSISSMHPA
jgi:hypothetical protein